MEFNIKRFSQIVYKDFLLYRKWFLLSMLFLFLAVFLLTFIGHKMVNIENGGASQPLVVVFFMTLIVLGGFFTSSNLGDFKTPQKRIQYLALPASTFEKVLSKWLYTLPVFILIIAGLFFLFFKTYTALFGTSFSLEAIDVNYKIETRMFPYFILLYVIGHSIAFFFSFYFNKFAAIKGALVSIGVFIGLALIRLLFNFSQIFEKDFVTLFFDAVWANMILIGDDPIKMLWIPPIFWCLTFLVAKRKQV